MVSTQDINWVAGLLEGEGTFSKRPPGHNPIIQLVMTDKDVVIRAAKILGAHKVIEAAKPTVTGKPVYRMGLYGTKAMQWMMTLYVLMGERRKSQIKACLDVWKNKKTRTYKERKSYSRGAKVVWSQEVIGDC